MVSNIKIYQISYVHVYGQYNSRILDTNAGKQLYLAATDV